MKLDYVELINNQTKIWNGHFSSWHLFFLFSFSNSNSKYLTDTRHCRSWKQIIDAGSNRKGHYSSSHICIGRKLPTAHLHRISNSIKHPLASPKLPPHPTSASLLIMNRIQIDWVAHVCSDSQPCKSPVAQRWTSLNSGPCHFFRVWRRREGGTPPPPTHTQKVTNKNAIRHINIHRCRHPYANAAGRPGHDSISWHRPAPLCDQRMSVLRPVLEAPP